MRGHEMRGLLADANAHGELQFLRRLLQQLELMEVLEAIGIELANFNDLGLPLDLDDRSLWEFCQRHEWVLFTDNRNHDGPYSLEATMRELWLKGCLPVITLGNKSSFQTNRDYASRVASDVADVLFGISQQQQFRDCPRIFVPLVG